MGLSSNIIIFVLVSLVVVNVYLTWRYRKQRNLLKKKNDQLLKNLRDARDDQKDIIYRNMHDQVNPLLRFVLRNLEVHQSSLRKNKLKPESLDRDIDVLLMALNDIRSCTHGEVPAALRESGYVHLLENMLGQRARSSGIEFNFVNATSFKNDLPFDHLRQTDMYRISSELIENIIRHSSSKRLDILLSADDEHMTVAFVHNGTGITNEQAEKNMQETNGVGLKSCQARARLMNAEINYFNGQELFTTELKVPFTWTTQ